MSGGTSTPDSTSSSGGEAYVPAPSESGGSTQSDPSNGGAGSGDSTPQVEQPGNADQRTGDGAENEARTGDGVAAGSSPAAGATERAERSATADASRAPGLSSSVSSGDSAASVSQGSALPIGAGPGLPPASGVTGSVDLAPGVLGGTSTAPGLLAIDTGGMKLLLASSFGCGPIPCYGKAAGRLASPALVSRIDNRPATESTVTEASGRRLFSVLGLPGIHRGPFFGLLGGGGSAAGFILLTFLAVLAAWLVRRIDWTTPLRIPAAVWPPPVYLSPLESPG